MSLQSKIKPIYIMNQPGVTPQEKNAVYSGLIDILSIAGVSLDINDFSEFRTSDYLVNGKLQDFKSVDWYIEQAKKQSRNTRQLNAHVLQNLLIHEPWRYKDEGGVNHYDVLIVKDDIYYFADQNFVIGGANEGMGTTISTYRFQGLEDRTKFECIKTQVMHEMGHVFGLIPDNRKENIDLSLGRHCANTCVMRQGLTIPDDFIRFSNDRLKYGSFCGQCLMDLKNYFKE